MPEYQLDFDFNVSTPTIEADFVLYAPADTYDFQEGFVVDGRRIYLAPANNETIGGVIIGDNISVTEDGVISIPQATDETVGVIRVATDEEAAEGTAINLCINPKQFAEAVEGMITLDDLSSVSPILYDNVTGTFSADFDSEPTENSGKFLTSGVIKTALDDKQDVIADLSTIRAGASAGATAVQPGDNISLLNNDANYQENTIELIEVNGVIQSINEKTVNIPVPTQASDIGALPDTTTIDDLTTNVQQNALNSGVTSGDVSLIRTALQPNDNISELNNDAGFISGINSSDVTNALGYTPYDSSNPDGYITGITSSDVTTALGYTPYNSTNPNGYQANVLEGVKVNGTSQTITNKTVDITVPTDTSDLTNGAGYITGINSSDVTEALGYTPYDSSNPDGFISGITSSDVTTALGYTPYDSSNPDGYITGIDSTAVTEALGYTPYDSSNPNGYISGITSSDVTTALGYTPYDSSNPDGYQANAIEVIKVNDVAQTITSKAVNIPVPTQPADIGAVPTSRTINNKALTSDITLNSSDVGALSSATTINDLTTTVQQNALNSGATTTNIGQIATNTSNISAINEKIPVQATSSNQLADKDFVNSSIATNTANFIGTFESVSNLEGYSGTVTNNDYAFVINGVVTDNGNDWSDFNSLDAYNKALLTNFDYAWVVNGSNFDLYRFDIITQEWDLRVSDTPKADVTLNTAYNRYKATVSGSSVTWEYEYTLNNSSFTASQWAAINSGITSGDVSLIQTALQPNDNISALTNDSGYITGITSSDVTTALGYTPYDSSNPDGYTSNVGTVTSVNNTQPDSNGNVTLVIPSTQVQADWDETDPDSKAYILNKPYIPSGVVVDQTYDSTSTNAQSGVAIAGAGFLTGITSSDVTTALGYTPYSNANPSGYQANVIETIKVNGTAQTVTSKAVDIPVPTDTSDLTNGAGYITGITSSDVTTALGYTPYNSTNPSGYQANVIETIKVNDVAQTVTSKAVNIPVPTDTSDLTNGAGFITGITSSDVTTALGYTPYDSSNPDGFISGITSSDVTTALGYTPYDSSNPDGYTSNVGTVTSVNNVQPVNGDVTIAIPSATSDLNNDSGFITSSALANYVTLDTDQNITGTKTYVGQKRIAFKQSGTSDKLGFTLYNSSGTEKGYLEYNPSNTVDSVPLMTLGNYASASGGLTHVGFRKYSSISGASGAYNLLAPLISDARTPFSLTTTYTNFYLPLGFKNGNTTVTTAKTGVADLSSLFTDYALASSVPTKVSDLTNDSGYITGITSSDVTTALGYTPENVSNKTTIIDSNSTDIQYPSAKSVYSTLTTKADIQLSNLDITGENRLHSLKGYLENGTLYSDSQLYNDVYKYACSTFDLSKFTITGTPTITNGILNIVNNNNRVSTKDTIIPSGTNEFDIYGSFTTPASWSAAYRCPLVFDYTLIMQTDSSLTDKKVYINGKSGGDWTGHIGETSINTSTKYYYRILQNSEKVQFYLGTNKNNLSLCGESSTRVVFGSARPAFFGCRPEVPAQYWDGTVDLKDFKVYVSGNLVFYDVKSGTDTIIPSSYTIFGTGCTVDSNDIASGFTSSSGVKYDINYAGNSYNTFELYLGEYTMTTASIGQWFYKNTATVGGIQSGFQIQFNNANKLRFFAGSGIANNDIFNGQIGSVTHSVNTKINIKLVFDGVNYILYSSVDGGAWVEEYSKETTLKILFPTEVIIGQDQNYFNGKVNLNKIKTYISGSLIFKVTGLSIPYTKSITGSKVVDVYYQDRVKDYYDLFGNALYYVIDEANQKAALPMGEIYGFIEQAKAGIPTKISDLTDDTATSPIDKADTLTGLTATVAELNYVDGVTSNIQTQLNDKVTKLSTAPTADTYTKVTINDSGLVTSGSSLDSTDVTTALGYTPQTQLVSGTNIKTINNNSLLGSGDITIDSLPAQSGQSGKFLTTDGSAASWGTPTDTKNTAGSTDTSSKIFLVGATSQTADSQTYSHDTAFVDANGRLNSAAPASAANDTTVATTAWVTGKGYLTSHQTIKQDGITGATVNRYGSCSTGASTAAKTVSITTGTFALETGSRVSVKFTNANTADSPTLNVNSTGAKNIFHNGAQITTGDNKALLAGTCDFVYDGTQWQLIGNYINTVPTVNDSTITIQQGGTTVDTFTTNQASNKTINIPKEVFIATYNVTSFSDVMTEINAGKLVLCRDTDSSNNDFIYMYRSHTSTTITFYNVSSISTTIVMVDNNNNWDLVDVSFLPDQTSQSGKFLTTNGTSASWGTPTDTKNTAGSTDTSSKIFLVGATSQAANPQTYSHDTAFVDTNGRLNSAAPASGANDTTVATTKWVKDQGYTTNTGTVKSVNNVQPDSSGNVTLPASVNALDELSDVTISSPSNGQVLGYDGTGWVNTTKYSFVIVDHTT